MGRIAEAFKKAQRERQEASASGSEPQAQQQLAQPGQAQEQPAEPVAPPAGPAPSGDALEPSLVVYHDKAALITEQYRSIRTRLLSQNPTAEHRVLAVTSSVPSEGKSVTMLNLGFALAELSHLKVLVVDGDFRRHSLAAMMRASDSPGLAELLRGQAQLHEALQPTPANNLHLVASGCTGQSNAAELLSCQQAAAVFQQFRQNYHYVLVDTPPAGTVTDVGIIGQMCDGVLLVIRMRSTPEPMVNRTVRLLQANNVNLIGCILVGYRRRRSRYPYDYGYDGGYDSY